MKKLYDIIISSQKKPKSEMKQLFRNGYYEVQR
jgi:hypothetical protein